MRDAGDIAFLPLAEGQVVLPPEARVLFLNGYVHPALAALADKGALVVQQHFFPLARALKDHGYVADADIPAGPFDMVLLALPKNWLEAQYFIARGLRALANGGHLIVAGGNKEGGGRIKKTLQQFGLAQVQDMARSKARVGWGIKESIAAGPVDAAIAAGGMQPVLDGAYVSMPGIFGWNRVDAGSALLLQHLPADLRGAGADFGCGYGMLARHLARIAGVTSLLCIDADARALAACRTNLAAVKGVEVGYLWADLTRTLDLAAPLDWIVMNPPFHTGKAEDIAAGQDFIRTARAALRPGGQLWMVANAHLPYEAVLQHNFQRCSKTYEGDGFKVFCAAR